MTLTSLPVDKRREARQRYDEARSKLGHPGSGLP